MNTQKHYISTVIIRNGEYETLTNYCLRSSDIKTAEKEVIEAFDIGGEDWEQQAELYSLNEVTAEEYEVLSRYI
jgi:hypothetical protein